VSAARRDQPAADRWVALQELPVLVVQLAPIPVGVDLQVVQFSAVAGIKPSIAAAKTTIPTITKKSPMNRASGAGNRAVNARRAPVENSERRVR
jgi:hypothetical protein